METTVKQIEAIFDEKVRPVVLVEEINPELLDLAHKILGHQL